MESRNKDLYNKINDFDNLYRELEIKLHLLDKKISELKVIYVKEALYEN